jgi:hypothetical protein
MIRERREELTTPIAYSASNPTLLTNGIPRDLPLSRVGIIVEGRLTVSGQTVAGNITEEAPQNLIRRVRVKGTKVTGGGSLTLVDCRAEELYILTGLYNQYRPMGSLIAELPGSGGSAFPAPLAATANGSYDFRFYMEVPFAPRFATHKDEIEGILDPSIFSLLDCELTWGAGTNAIQGGTLTQAVSAFGSASGTPQARIVRFSPLAAPIRDSIMKYHYQYVSKYLPVGTNVGATFTDTKLTDVNAGNRVRFLMLRQYLENAGVTGQFDSTAGAAGSRVGDNSNIGLYRWRVKINGSEKHRMFNRDQVEENRQQFCFGYTTLPRGYTVIDWAQRGFLEDIFDAKGFGAAAVRFELFADGLSLAGGDKLDMLTCEQIPVEV